MKRMTFKKPYPKQEQFLRARCRYTAYGGARGGGKSHVARMKAELLCLRYAGIQILFMRRTYPELKENHLLPAMRELNGIAQYKGTDKAFLFPNGSRLKFGYCQYDKDLLQYQGQAYDVIFLEECTQFPENVFTTMTESNRSSGLMQEAFRPRMYFTCNPGGVGHAWFKRLFIDRDYKPTERPEDYLFIQATVHDNVWLMEHSPDYVRALENLPDDRRRAMLYGDWDVFEGQYFPEFRRETHTCEPFAIPDYWRRYVAIDYGLDMLAAYWVAVDEEDAATVYQEVYEPDLIVPEAAKRLLEVNGGEHITAWFAPKDLWNRRQETGRSVADIFAEEGLYLDQVSNGRIAGWYELKRRLQVVPNRFGDKRPRLQIFRTCTNLIRTLPALQHDEKHPNDCATEPHEITHAPDAIRYFCDGCPLPASVPVKREYRTYEEEFADVMGY